MSTQSFILLLIGAVIVVYAALALRAYLRLRGRRVVICPETRQPAGVTVDAAHAALGAVRETADIRLESCSRWPERQECDQACTSQIALSPEDTLVTSIVRRWYAGKACALCRREIQPIRADAPKPGLLNPPTRDMVGWESIPAEALPAVLDSHLPVCANCYLAETFRRQFPDRVTDRAETDKRDLAVH